MNHPLHSDNITAMHSLPLMMCGETLFDAMRALETVADRGQHFIRSAHEDSHRSYAATMHAAACVQAGLLDEGLRRGDRVVLSIGDPARFILAFFGAIRAGIVPVPTAPLTNDTKVDHLLRLDRARATTQASAIIVGSSAELATQGLSALAQRTAVRLAAVDELGADGRALDVDPHLQLSDICFLQHTSGSTGDPKVVVVRHGQLAANVRLMASPNAIAPQQGDRSVSWLPFWHDMGLIGLMIVPAFYAAPSIFIPPDRFVRSPSLWMSTISKYRATVTYAPNFAFDLVTRRVSDQALSTLDLSCLRVLGCGAEPINPSILRSFAAKYSRAGLPLEAVTPSYGMAEATLAMTFDSPNRPLRSMRIDRKAYEVARRVVPLPNHQVDHQADKDLYETTAAALEVVSCGETGEGHQVAIVDQQRRPLAEGLVGEIAFRGPSVTGEYHDNAGATHATFSDGWLYTGDLGFMHAGQLFVSGRSKDLLIVRGRNYYPQDLEWVASSCPGARSGSVVAFSVALGATEAAYVVVETTRHYAGQGLAAQITQQIQARIGLSVSDVLLVPAGTIPRTTSGKPRRAETRRQFLDGRLARLRLAAEFDVNERTTSS